MTFPIYPLVPPLVHTTDPCHPSPTHLSLRHCTPLPPCATAPLPRLDTKGALPELIDIIIEEKAALFVCAVGVPPKWAVDKLHAAGIPCMNMIGAPKHVHKACAVGMDLICAQGGEGGGHTGDVATSVLIPKVVDLCQQYTSPLTGKPVQVVAAGGIFDGRGLAMSISMGAQAVWVGTRMICAAESGAPPRHKKAVVKAGYNDTVRSIIFTGRPMRVLKTPYIMDWQENRSAEIKQLTSQGILPAGHDQKLNEDKYATLPLKERMGMRPLLMGSCVGAIDDIKPAKDIVEEMVTQAVALLEAGAGMVSRL